MLTLVHLCKGETLTELAAGLAVGATTARRYIREASTLLADRSPGRDQALRAARRAGYAQAFEAEGLEVRHEGQGDAARLISDERG